MIDVTHIHLYQNRLKEIGLKASVLECYMNNQFLMADMVFSMNNYFQEYIKDNSIIQKNEYWLIKLPPTERITKDLGLSANEQKTAFKKIKFKTILFKEARYLQLWGI